MAQPPQRQDDAPGDPEVARAARASRASGDRPIRLLVPVPPIVRAVLTNAQKDPKLWMMKCKPNHEKMLMISLMQKFLDSQQTEKPLQITSALVTSLKGYIYIEAFKEAQKDELAPPGTTALLRATALPAKSLET